MMSPSFTLVLGEPLQLGTTKYIFRSDAMIVLDEEWVNEEDAVRGEKESKRSSGPQY